MKWLFLCKRFLTPAVVSYPQSLSLFHRDLNKGLKERHLAVGLKSVWGVDDKQSSSIEPLKYLVKYHIISSYRSVDPMCTIIICAYDWFDLCISLSRFLGQGWDRVSGATEQFMTTKFNWIFLFFLVVFFLYLFHFINLSLCH